jgi:DNA-binding beta-propeller fold protein YncE
MLLNPANGIMYVVNWNSENIYEIDTTTKRLVDVFHLNGPKYIAHNAANRNIYASSGWNDTVNVISMRSIISGNTCSLPNKFYTALGQNYFQNSIPRTSKKA